MWGACGRFGHLHSFLPGHKAPNSACRLFPVSPSLPTILPSPSHTCARACPPPSAAVNTVAQTRSCQPAAVGGGARRMPSLPGQRRSNWHLSELQLILESQRGPCRPAASRLGLRASLCPSPPPGLPQLRPSHPAAGVPPQMAPGVGRAPVRVTELWEGHQGLPGRGCRRRVPRAESCTARSSLTSRFAFFAGDLMIGLQGCGEGSVWFWFWNLGGRYEWGEQVRVTGRPSEGTTPRVSASLSVSVCNRRILRCAHPLAPGPPLPAASLTPLPIASPDTAGVGVPSCRTTLRLRMWKGGPRSAP